MLGGVLQGFLVIAERRVRVAQTPAGAALPDAVSQLLRDDEMAQVVVDGLLVVPQ